MNNLFLNVLNMSAAASIVIIAIIVARLFIKRAPKKFSYLLWIAAAFRLACPVSIRSAFSLFRLAPIKTPAVQSGAIADRLDYASALVQRIGERSAAGALPQAAASAVPQAVSTAIPQAVSSAAPIVETSATSSPVIGGTIGGAVPGAGGSDTLGTVLGILAAVWLIGFAALMGYGIISYFKMKRRLATATRYDGNVFRSENVLSPFILGFFKPRIYIPYGLDSEALGYVLAHERYHYKRRDYIINAFAFLLLAVHWFNPLCWLAYYLMTRDMEMSCDEKVLSGGSVNKTYSETLLSFAVKKQFPQPAPLAFGESSVKTRIKNAMKYKKPRTFITVLVSVICVIVVAACAVNPAQNLSTEAPVESGEPTQTDEPIGYAVQAKSIYSDGKTHFFIKDDSSLWGWGECSSGQLGKVFNAAGGSDGSAGIIGCVSEPIKILDNVSRLINSDRQYVTGWQYGAITNDGALYTWGKYSDDDGVILIKEPSKVLDNVRTAYLNKIIFYNGIFSIVNFALTDDGSVWRWDNSKNASTPEKIFDGIENIRAEYDLVQMLSKDGTLYAFGPKVHGFGIEPNDLEPVKIMDNVHDFGARYVIKTDSSLWGWGSIFNPAAPDTPRKIADDVKSVIPVLGAENGVYSPESQKATFLFIKNDNSLWGIGNSGDILFDGERTGKFTAVEPVHLLDNIVSASIAAYNPAGAWMYVPSEFDPDDETYHGVALALNSDGELYSWGSNASGALGRPDVPSEDVALPAIVATNVKSYATDGRSTFVLKKDGTLLACGYNGENGNDYSEPKQSRLGDGTFETRREFIKILDGISDFLHVLDWKMVSTYVPEGGEDWMVNYTRTFAAASDGRLYFWGTEGSVDVGELGVSVNTPKEIAAGIRVK